MTNPYYYIGANPTVDLVIINPEGKILLIKRTETSPACAGMWALPGGFIDTLAKRNEAWLPGHETPQQAAFRELQEETNLKLENVILSPVGFYEGNQRDPRDNDISWSRSFPFFHQLDPQVYEAQKEHIRGMDDAENADWFTLEEVRSMKLAFDHNKIIEDALALYYKANIKAEGKKFR